MTLNSRIVTVQPKWRSFRMVWPKLTISGDREWELPGVLYSIYPWKDGQKAPLPKVQNKTPVVRDL